MEDSKDSRPILKESSAIGLWTDDHAIISHHKGSTFHKLAFGRSTSDLFLSLEETVFALLRTDFVLVDLETRKHLTAESLLQILKDGSRIGDLLRVHVYLAFRRLGKCPKLLRASAPQRVQMDLETYFAPFKNARNQKVEPHLLLEFFRNNWSPCPLTFRTELTHPIYSVNGLDTYLTLPDVPAHNILEQLIATPPSHDCNSEADHLEGKRNTPDNQPRNEKIKCLVAISNFDSVYFLSVEPF